MSHQRVPGFVEKVADLLGGPGSFQGVPGTSQRCPENFWGT